MIEIIAIAPTDGWAFIRKENKKIFLIEPPYKSSDISEVSEKMVENAVGIYGFEECEITFHNMKDVIRYIKDQFISSRKDLGIEIPSLEQLKELLEYFEDNVLLEYLGRAHQELIPRGKLDAAEEIALDILKLERAENDHRIKENAISVIEECTDLRKRRLRFQNEIRSDRKKKWGEIFPKTTEKYSQSSIDAYCKSVRRRRQLLPVRVGV